MNPFKIRTGEEHVELASPLPFSKTREVKNILKCSVGDNKDLITSLGNLFYSLTSRKFSLYSTLIFLVATKSHYFFLNQNGGVGEGTLSSLSLFSFLPCIWSLLLCLHLFFVLLFRFVTSTKPASYQDAKQVLRFVLKLLKCQQL